MARPSALLNSCEATRRLSPEEIAAVLSIYKPEHRYITEADLGGLHLSCSLRLSVYPYTIEQPFDYVTAPSAVLLICQMMYLLVGGLVLEENPVADVIGGWDRFLSLRDDAFLRIGNLQTDFLAKVDNKVPISGEISIERHHRFRSVMHARFRYRIGSGIKGKVHGLILEG